MNTGRRVVSMSTRIRSHFPRGRLQIRVDVVQDLQWQTEVLMIQLQLQLQQLFVLRPLQVDRGRIT